MPGVYEELGNIQQPELRGEVKRGVTVVCEVGILQALEVVLDDAFEEGEIFEADGSTDADGDVNHSSYGIRIPRINVCLQISMAEVELAPRPEVKAKVLFGSD